MQTRSRRTALVVRAGGTVSTNDFKNGLTVEVDGTPYKVVGEHQQLQHLQHAENSHPALLRQVRDAVKVPNAPQYSIMESCLGL